MAKRGLWLKLATVPAVITLSLLGLTGSGRASDGVQMNDDCDPTSFNSIGLGEICQGDGETSFTQFITQVSTLGNAPAWNFDPKTLHVQAGEPISLENDGGETHTFTKVAAPGGGFVIPLNGALAKFGLGTPRPECVGPNGGMPDVVKGILLTPAAPSAPNVFVPSDGEATVATGPNTPLTGGTYLFQCCIHPWMQTTVTVGPGEGADKES